VGNDFFSPLKKLKGFFLELQQQNLCDFLALWTVAFQINFLVIL
jgi:hypothetical protein